MKIKRLEISGFKSFVEKSSFDFPAGVTAVVGPNGCGKSNVVDAIRWVMGEQSVKNLRGRQMEDVIFGGSESRKPLGMAEVSLVFSTGDGYIPAKYLNYSEIQVTRRLYRDGESEYLLNKTPCRLMDITELFMDTGVGARAYSIIEQGRIGMILMAKPEERRFLIEEAAGVTKYKSRKQLALKKIEATRQNLLRIGDIVSEIRRQLNSLHRQAKKAERFKSVREELRGIELHFSSRRRDEIIGGKTALEAGISKVSAEEQAAIAILEKRSVELEVRRLALIAEEKQLSGVQEEIFQGKSELQGAENRIEFQRKELLTLERQLVRAREEMLSLEKQMESAAQEQTLLEQRRSEFLSESTGEEQALEGRMAELEELSAAEKRVFASLEESRRRLFSLLNEINQLANQKLAAAKRVDALAEKVQRSRSEEMMVRERLGEATGRIKELESRLASELGALEELERSLAGLGEKDKELRSCLVRDENALQSGRDELSRVSSRLHSLQELEQQFAGYGQGVRSILQSDGFRSRFAGIVADALEADDEHEAAVEAVLGDRLQALLSKDAGDVLDAVAHLKNGSGGRCSFLLPAANHTLPDFCPEGCEPLLKRVVIPDDKCVSVEPLLANVFLVPDLGRGMTLSQKHPGLRFVTLQGDVACDGGMVDAGSRESAQQGLIHKKREIRELSAQKVDFEARVQDLAEVRDRCRADISAVEAEIKELGQARHQAEISLLTLQKDLQRATEETHRLDELLVVRSMEDGQLHEEKELLEKEISTAESGLVTLEGMKSGLEAEVASLQEDLAQRRQIIEYAREEVTAMKVRAAALKEKRDSTERSVQRTLQLQADLSARVARQTDELTNGEAALEQLQTAIVEAGAQLKQLVLDHSVREEKLAVARDHYESMAKELREEDASLRDFRGEVDELHRQKSEMTLQLSGLTMELDNLAGLLRERYRMELHELAPLPDITADIEEELRKRQTELQKQVDEIGEVNLTAIEEYQELEERHTFLSAQKADLEESLHSLQQAIQRINRTTRKRFAETFQQVNEKFKDVFPRLFCGGRAELKLTNEEDLLETGLDIIVQPPGKKLQNVSLLSGGEKALTAVALIFSIFLIKPSPFCLLDEVDAPLDDANIGRFNDMIREMSAFSQFILITHSKTTMAVADTLYGVTMEEPGVSKLVSVKLQ